MGKTRELYKPVLVCLARTVYLPESGCFSPNVFVTVTIATMKLDNAGPSVENSCWLRDGGQSRKPCSGPKARVGTDEIRW